MIINPIPSQIFDIIKQQEGCRLDAYADAGKGVLTIGYGETGKWVTPHLSITQEMADELLQERITQAATSVCRLTKVNINDNQYAALIDFVYNEGAGRYQSSSVRARLNRGEYASAAAAILKYVYAGGRILPGLIKRRRLEYQLFMS